MIHGSYVALITPLTAENAIDYPVLSRLIKWHIASNTSGLVMLGSTGEAATIRAEERRALIKAVVMEVNGRLPVIVGTGSSSTDATIVSTQEAFALGADACLVVTPPYVRPTEAGLKAHFKALDDATDGPLWLYHVPSRTGCDLSPRCLADIVEHCRSIVAFKDATGDLSYMAEVKALVPKRCALLSGDDGTLLSYLQAGGDGVISVVANVAPTWVQSLCEGHAAGNRAQAETMSCRLAPLNKALAMIANPIAIKYLLAKLGLCQNVMRLPLMPPQSHQALDALISDIKGDLPCPI